MCVFVCECLEYLLLLLHSEGCPQSTVYTIHFLRGLTMTGCFAVQINFLTVIHPVSKTGEKKKRHQGKTGDTIPRCRDLFNLVHRGHNLT